MGKRTQKKIDLLGAKEVAEYLGWDRRRVSLYCRRGILPDPVADLASGPIWTKQQIEKFKKKEESTVFYTTWGSVRGDCGHAHRTAEAARRCIQQDQRDCDGHGGYSDRVIRVISSRDELDSYDVQRGQGEPLSLDDD